MQGHVIYQLGDFPPFPGETDDTGRFKRAIRAMAPSGTLFVPAGLYAVKEITVTKSISLWFAEGAWVEASDRETAFLFRFAGEKSADGYPMLREAKRGDRALYLPPSAARDIKEGDVIWLSDDSARPSDGQQEINCEVHEVAEVEFRERELLGDAVENAGLRVWESWEDSPSGPRGTALICSEPIPVEAGRFYRLEVSAKHGISDNGVSRSCYVEWVGKQGKMIARSDVISFSYKGWHVHQGCNWVAPRGATCARIFLRLPSEQAVQSRSLSVEQVSFKEVFTKLTVCDFIRLPKRVARVNVVKITPLMHCRIVNFRYRLKQGASKGFGILAQQVRHFHVNGLYAEQGVESAIQVRRSMDVTVENFMILPPQRLGSGQGYGVQFFGGNLGVVVRNGYACRTRHAVDLDSTFDAVVEGVTDMEGRGVSFLLTHNGWGGDMVFRHCRSLCSGSSGFVAETQGAANPYDLTHPNIHIIDCAWQRDVRPGNGLCYGFGVWLKAPVSGRIERFTAEAGMGLHDVEGMDNAAVRLLPVGNRLHVCDVAARGLRRGLVIAHPHETDETEPDRYICVDRISVQHCQSAIYVNGGWGKRLYLRDLTLDQVKKYVIEGNQTGGYEAFVMERVSITNSPSAKLFQSGPMPRSGSVVRGWIRRVWRDWVSKVVKR
ncbi:hypothetical protein CLV36_104114 [Laceyella sediminis]|uniref:Pectate lyase-like protein n=1 Tax=Laceyella sediminis TaxID=573074 RepID=A0ABX5EQ41_9BACL|nr:hypothetical protein [Laceyella sediminis]PRZ15391.1 hypothetical protein CLV36_104114 [Laceyella sediminis]